MSYYRTATPKAKITASILCDTSDGSWIVRDLITKEAYRHDNYDGANARYTSIMYWYSNSSESYKDTTVVEIEVE